MDKRIRDAIEAMNRARSSDNRETWVLSDKDMGVIADTLEAVAAQIEALEAEVTAERKRGRALWEAAVDVRNSVNYYQDVPLPDVWEDFEAAVAAYGPDGESEASHD